MSRPEIPDEVIPFLDCVASILADSVLHDVVSDAEEDDLNEERFPEYPDGATDGEIEEWIDRAVLWQVNSMAMVYA